MLQVLFDKEKAEYPWISDILFISQKDDGMSNKFFNFQGNNYGQINIAMDHSVIYSHQATQTRQLGQPSWASQGIVVLQNPAGIQPYYSLFDQVTKQLSLQHPLNHLLILADRVLMHAKDDTNKKELKDLPTQLKQLQESESNPLHSDIESFLSPAIRQWFDTLHQCLFPEKWKQNENIPDEIQICLDLNLFSMKEFAGFAPLELFQTMDPGNYFKRWRAAFIYPLNKHYQMLRKALRSIVLYNQPVEDHVHLQMIKEERQFHLQKYVDRPEPLREVIEQLKNTKRKYLLIIGKAGIGKTALCSKLSEELANPSQHHSSLPWLPNIILHYCKQLKNPKDIIETWLIQANLLLVNKLSLPHFHLDQPEARNLMSKAMFQILHQITLECGETIFLIDALDELSIPPDELSFLPETLPDEAKVIISARTGSETKKWLKANRETTIYELGSLKRKEIPLFTKLDDKIEKEFHDKLWAASEGWTLYISFAAQEIQEKRGNTKEIEVTQINRFYNQQLKKWIPDHLSSEDQPLKEILGLLAIFETIAPLSLAKIQSYLRSRQMNLSKHQLQSFLAQVGDQISGVQSDSVMLQINTFAKHIREKFWTKHEYKEELSKMTHWLGTDPDISIRTIAQFVLTYSSNEDQLKKLIEYLNINNPERIFDVGMHIFLHFGINMPQSTIPFIEVSAKQGNPKAMYLMSQLAIRNESEKWIEKLFTKLQEEDTTLFQLFQKDPILTKYFEEKYQLAKDKERSKDSDFFASLGLELLQWFRNDDAIYWLDKAAKLHHPGAMRVLGVLFIGRTEETHKGQQWLQKSAEAGDHLACYQLGEHLIEGKYIQRNVKKGEQWLRKASDHGNTLAMYRLGTYLIEGKYLPLNVEEGEKWLRKAVDHSNPLAMYRLGTYLIEGNYLPLNVEEGEKWLRKAADHGSSKAMYQLGTYLIEGVHLTANIEEGEKWLRKAADHGSPKAMYQLGTYLAEGVHLTANIEEGEKWLRKAADHGSPKAMYRLGTYLVEGVHLTANIEEGEKWLRKAADHGNTKAMYQLGTYLIEGVHLSTNVGEGEQWLRKAADHGNTKAMYRLGTYLIEGNYLPMNVGEGEQWLRKAAENGVPMAMYQLGTYLIEGDYLPMNVGEGEKWLHKAAKDEYEPAQQTLASPLKKKERELRKQVTQGRKWATLKFLFLLIHVHFFSKGYTRIKRQLLHHKDSLPWIWYVLFRGKLSIQRINFIKIFIAKYSGKLPNNKIYYLFLIFTPIFLRVILSIAIYLLIANWLYPFSNDRISVLLLQIAIWVVISVITASLLILILTILFILMVPSYSHPFFISFAYIFEFIDPLFFDVIYFFTFILCLYCTFKLYLISSYYLRVILEKKI
jgi:TPR repeat protein/Cdc6-like AAA superfamily ATPase